MAAGRAVRRINQFTRSHMLSPVLDVYDVNEPYVAARNAYLAPLFGPSHVFHLPALRSNGTYEMCISSGSPLSSAPQLDPRVPFFTASEHRVFVVDVHASQPGIICNIQFAVPRETLMAHIQAPSDSVRFPRVIEWKDWGFRGTHALSLLPAFVGNQAFGMRYVAVTSDLEADEEGTVRLALYDFNPYRAAPVGQPHNPDLNAAGLSIFQVPEDVRGSLRLAYSKREWSAKVLGDWHSLTPILTEDAIIYLTVSASASLVDCNTLTAVTPMSLAGAKNSTHPDDSYHFLKIGRSIKYKSSAFAVIERFLLFRQCFLIHICLCLPDVCHHIPVQLSIPY